MCACACTQHTHALMHTQAHTCTRTNLAGGVRHRQKSTSSEKRKKIIRHEKDEREAWKRRKREREKGRGEGERERD